MSVLINMDFVFLGQNEIDILQNEIAVTDLKK